MLAKVPNCGVYDITVFLRFRRSTAAGLLDFLDCLIAQNGRIADMMWSTITYFHRVGSTGDSSM